MTDHGVENDQFGFTWGPMKVVRYADLNPARDALVLGIETVAGQKLEVYVSGKGRSLRVFRPGKGELK